MGPLCFENCCILLIYLSTLGLHLSCYVYVPSSERGFIKNLVEIQGNHISCSILIHVFPMSSKIPICLYTSSLQTFCWSVPLRSQAMKHPQILFCIIICAELPKTNNRITGLQFLGWCKNCFKKLASQYLTSKSLTTRQFENRVSMHHCQ